MFDFPMGRFAAHMQSAGLLGGLTPVLQSFAALYARRNIYADQTMNELQSLRFHTEVELRARSPSIRAALTPVHGFEWALICEAEYGYLLDLSGALDLLIQVRRDKMIRESAAKLNVDRLAAELNKALSSTLPEPVPLFAGRAVLDSALSVACLDVPTPTREAIFIWAQEAYDEVTPPIPTAALMQRISEELRVSLSSERIHSLPLEALMRVGSQALLNRALRMRDSKAKPNVRVLMPLERMFSPSPDVFESLGWWNLTGIACYRLSWLDAKKVYRASEADSDLPLYYIINVVPAMPKTHEHANGGSFATDGNQDGSESLSIKSASIPRRPDGAVDYGLWATVGGFYDSTGRLVGSAWLHRFTRGDLKSNQVISQHINMEYALDDLWTTFMLGSPANHPLNFTPRGIPHFNATLYPAVGEETSPGRNENTPAYAGSQIFTRLKQLSVYSRYVFWLDANRDSEAVEWMSRVQSHIARVAHMNSGARAALLYRSESLRELITINSLLQTTQSLKDGTQATFDTSMLRK